MTWRSVPPAAQRVMIAGEAVTFERSSDSPTGWCATAWEKGLPVARRPIELGVIEVIIGRYPNHAVTYGYR